MNSKSFSRRAGSTAISLNERMLTFFILILNSIYLSVRVRRLAVVDVVAVQVGELWQELEDGLPVVSQVGHLTVKQVETLQLGQLFLDEDNRT